ncbi:MAG: hypothetical protein EA389_16595 [Ilumatobacter sp.]|nr:MAG: hypothetical protein EA389_16595 [Ilumatobacter sp.]
MRAGPRSRPHLTRLRHPPNPTRRRTRPRRPLPTPVRRPQRHRQPRPLRKRPRPPRRHPSRSGSTRPGRSPWG